MNEPTSAVGRYARPPDAKDAPPAIESQGCFGVRRAANGLSVMIDLRTRSGDRIALPYSHLLDLKLAGGATITATFTKVQITINGRGLTGLYERIAEQRVAWVREADRIDAFDDPDESDQPLVEEIKVESDDPATDR